MLENQIKCVIENKLEDGTVERLVEEHFEKGVSNALNKMFESYGDVTKAIEAQLKSVLLPFIESYDYSQYVVKLDTVLTDLLNNSQVENRKLLENFKDLMTPDVPKKVTLEEIFKKYTEHVAKNVDTDDLEVEYDNEPTYQSVECTGEFEHLGKRFAGSYFERGLIKLNCLKDERMTFEIELSAYNFSRQKWTIDNRVGTSIESLSILNDFEIYIIKLAQFDTEIDLSEEYHEDDVTPNKRPEAEYR